MSERFGPFVLERLLGRGGMAEAYIAHRADDADRSPAVLKRIRPDYASSDEHLRRFVLEAQVASRVVHPNLVRFREFGRVGSCHYIAMDMVRGHSLHRLLECVFDSNEPPPPSAALTIGTGILDGLAAMHAVTDEQGHPRPMLHRDVTPSNVIVTTEGRAVIIDFGITKDVMGPAITLPGRVIGTVRYMSPEHRRAEFIDPRADVFSASVILFELLFGINPWPPISSLKELLRHTFDPPVIPDDLRGRIPEDITQVVLRGLECEPEHRFEDAPAMSRALRACEHFPELADHGYEAVAVWARGLALPLDEELADPVLDLSEPTDAEEPLVWTSAGSLSTDEHSAEDPTLVPSDILSIPPLPPRRDAGLDPFDGHAAAAGVVPSKRVWVWAAIALIVAIGAVVFFTLGAD